MASKDKRMPIEVEKVDVELSRILMTGSIVAASTLGQASLIIFVFFVVIGPLDLLAMGFTHHVALGLNFVLSMLFFVQHSGMVRRAFRAYLSSTIQSFYFGPIYTMASGLVLILTVLFWQSTTVVLLELHGPARWVVQGLSLSALVGCVWVICALKSFDLFGLAQVRAKLIGQPAKSSEFVVAGPYRWVRHPLYFFVIVLIWAYPDVTSDRLLFNAIWTVWILVGAALEEADLVSEFGDVYRNYQRSIPMWIPKFRIFSRIK